MPLLRRIAIILSAYVVSTLAATLVIAAVASVMAVSIPGTPMPRLLGAIGMVFQAATYAFVTVGAAAFIPWMIVVVPAEIFRLRSILFYGAIGCAVGAASLFGLRLVQSLIMFRPKPPAAGFAMNFAIPWFILAAGLVAGVVYWAIAGRNAGAWRTRQVGS
jgi:hypothetical protein